MTCVQFVPKERLFWSAGKDGLLKQWDADKFERIQVLSLHSAEIRAITQTSDGKFLVTICYLFFLSMLFNLKAYLSQRALNMCPFLI